MSPPNHQQSEVNLERLKLPTLGASSAKRLETDWSRLPKPAQIHDRSVARVAVHPAARALALENSKFDAGSSDAVTSAGPSSSNASGTSLNQIQQKLRKQVSSIEEFIKIKLQAAATGKGADSFVDTISRAPLAPPARTVVERVSSAQFAQKAQDLFDRLDKNKSGKLTRCDLARALQEPAIRGVDAQVLAAMYSQFDNLTDICDGGLYGLSKKDLQSYGLTERKYAQKCEMARKLARRAANPDNNFVRAIGVSGSNCMSEEQLRDAVLNSLTRAEDRSLVEFMIDHYDSIAGAHCDRYSWDKKGITLDDMVDYEGKLSHSEEYKTVLAVNNILQRTNESQNSSCDALFSNKFDALSCISPEAIKQGTIGDCYFEAAVASVAQKDPSSIKDMIKENGDGTYTVTFPGASDEPLIVSAPTEAERGLFNNGSPSGTWVSVLEKANGYYAQQHFWQGNVLMNLAGGEVPGERSSDGGGSGGSSGGGGLGNGLSLLTGSHVEMHLLQIEKRESLQKCLDAAFNSSQRKCIITFTGPDLPGLRAATDNFVRSHVYSVLAYDPSGPDGGTLTIRDPYQGTTTAGTTKISFEQYRANFCGFYAEV